MCIDILKTIEAKKEKVVSRDIRKESMVSNIDNGESIEHMKLYACIDTMVVNHSKSLQQMHRV